MFSPNLSIKTCVHFMRGAEGNYVIFVFISFKREGNEYNVSHVYIKTKHSVAAAAASKENRRDDATHIIFIMRIDNRPFHLQATDEISNCFYCCVLK